MATRTEEAEGELNLHVVLEEGAEAVLRVQREVGEPSGFLVLNRCADGLACKENMGHVEEHGIVASQPLHELITL